MYKYLAILCVSLFTVDAYAESDCLNKLKGTNVKSIVDTCFTFEKGKTDMAILFGTNFSHEFGTKDKPSSEAVYLKKLADNGNPQAQFVWGNFVLGLAYNNESNLEMQKEAEYWIDKSANNGYPLAMFSIVNSYVNSSALKSEEEKMQAIALAELLLDNGFPKAKELLNKIKGNNSKDDFILTINKLYQNHEKLNEQQILDLASVFSIGRYYYSQHGSLNLGRKNSKVSKDFERSVFLLKHLIKVHKTPEAGYQLGKLLEKKNSGETVKYYLWAAKNEHPEAAGWIGEFYFCTGEKETGMNWLNKAKTLGYEYAEDALGEIEDLGEPTTCQPSWNSWANR
ncbi:sel1 repeat family protein [Pseudoalteromonas luteoviolacea]|uniref:sel1 repeat family protein n=1 Tax=Pseudoalteromonas luteoviolacea TaxID=43657 RepID=UPI001B35DE23|nr:sel1 repeat family protein [Pseudoalteromonas luteoviolacea]MBQ4810272.1 sel1 repeat family protein [Pseudoalteromonas luteoviolacea]